jgi:selenocysteine-specific elongation factor
VKDAGERLSGPIALTIGTAGHVDHGKTTLVRYMTGTDTDRLEEEHRRGISIVPGYAELELPSGRRASLVDVPGHERFVKNMVSGATGVDAFLLVVAADDGVMPQTREHLDVLRVLGVEKGVVALTKIDAVDEETAELAALDVEELLESTGITAPVVPLSGTTGEGMEKLLEELDALAADPPDWRSAGLASLPVDRAFVLKGIGVVYGDVVERGDKPGDTLHTASATVRGCAAYRITAARRGRLPGSTHRPRPRRRRGRAGRARRGPPLAPCPRDQEPRRAPEAARGREAPRPWRQGATPSRHAFDERSGSPLEPERLLPGESVLARLRLDEPLILLPGDRFVLRSMAPQVPSAGGRCSTPLRLIASPSPAGWRLWRAATRPDCPARPRPRARRGHDRDDLSLAVSVAPRGDPAAVESSRGDEVGELYALTAKCRPRRSG